MSDPSGASVTYVGRAALQFWVPGRPQSAGSKSIVPITRGGVVVARRVVESGDRAKKATWRGDLRQAAADAMAAADWPLMQKDVPVELRLVIVRARPSSHWRTGRNAGRLHERVADARPVQRPDSTKIARAVEDALSGVVWVDDSQIVRAMHNKAWSDDVLLSPGEEGVIVTVRQAGPYFGVTIDRELHDPRYRSAMVGGMHNEGSLNGSSQA